MNVIHPARLGAVLALLAAVPHRLPAAQLGTEPFAAGANGWSAISNFATVVYADGAALISFQAQGFPNPEDGALAASNSASSGSFTGNYAAAGISLLAFEVMATGAVPSDLAVELAGPAGYVRRSFEDSIGRTGAWYAVAASLLSAAAGGWNEAPAGCFSAVLADVRHLQISAARNGLSAQLVRIDNVHLGVNHRALDFPPPVADEGALSWGDLRVGQLYTLQTAAEPGGVWSDVVGFAATGAIHTVSLPTLTNAPWACFRLVQ